MSILSWNCQGCKNPSTVRLIREFICSKNQQFFFLVEIKLLVEVARKGIKVGKGCRYIGVDSMGNARGLFLCWQHNWVVNPMKLTNRGIIFILEDE